MASRKLAYDTATLKRRLRVLADPEFAKSQQRYFREPVETLGVRTPALRRLATEAARHYRTGGPRLDQILEIGSSLWGSGLLEERVLGVLIVAKFRRHLDEDGWKIVRGWARDLSNWAETDALAIELIAHLVTRDPGRLDTLRTWACSQDRWQRRAAAVSMVPLARRGRELDRVFDVAGLLAEDPDEIVQKAVGWLLKEASRSDPEAVLEFLRARRDSLPRLVLRTAAEGLPESTRAELRRT